MSRYQAGVDADTLELYCENTVANELLPYTARRCAGGGAPFTCRAAIPKDLSLTGPFLRNCRPLTCRGRGQKETSKGTLCP